MTPRDSRTPDPTLFPLRSHPLPSNSLPFATPEALGRRQSFSATLGGATLQSVAYGYDGFGRLESVASPDLGAIYAYHPGSSLIDEIEHTFGAGIGGSPVTAARAYDALDRLESIGYTVGGQTAPVTAHAYLYDAANRRTQATREDGTYWEYGYNDRDEVASAVKNLPGGQPLAGWQQGFGYDNIGNRLTATEGGDASGQNRRTVSYTTNRLNQYTGIQRPGKFDVLGVAHPDATVTVNGETATRQSAFWRREVSTNTGTGPAWVELDARATRTGVGVNGGDVTAKLGGSQFVDPFWLEPHYDADGNQLSDGRWAYTWDADNKLLGMRTHPVAVAAGAPEEKYEFTYDSGWRRIRTRVWRWDEEKLGDEADTLGAWVMVRDERTVYDEWNPVAQIDAAGQVVQRHLWGTDLSGTPQGAGGVGGLLGTWDNGATTREGSEPGDGVARVWVCAYDGNGNVSAAIAATVAGGGASGAGGAGTVRVARYNYDAFGKTLATWGDGAVAETNRYRFSTKPEDGTGLLYYGYRYLDTRLGRWVSRDPIGERGGMNIISIEGNNLNSMIDRLGLEIVATQGNKPCEGHYARPIDLSRTQKGEGWPGTPIESQTLNEFLDSISKDVNDGGCKCLRKLTISSHGGPDAFDIASNEVFTKNGIDDSTDFGVANFITPINASSFFSKLKKSICLYEKCEIILMSCNVGLGNLLSIIANMTGCKVIAPLGYIRPNCEKPTSEIPVRPKGASGDETPFEGSEPKWETINPDPNF